MKVKIEKDFRHFDIVAEDTTSYTVNIVVPYRLKAAMINLLHDEETRPTKLNMTEKSGEEEKFYIPVTVKIPKGDFVFSDVRIIENNDDTDDRSSLKEMPFARNQLIELAQKKLESNPVLQKQLRYFSAEEIIDLLTIGNIALESIRKDNKLHAKVLKNYKRIDQLRHDIRMAQKHASRIAEDFEYLSAIEKQYIDIHTTLELLEEELNSKGTLEQKHAKTLELIGFASRVKNSLETKQSHQVLRPDQADLSRETHRKVKKIITNAPKNVFVEFPQEVLKGFMQIDTSTLQKLFKTPYKRVQNRIEGSQITLEQQAKVIAKLEERLHQYKYFCEVENEKISALLSNTKKPIVLPELNAIEEIETTISEYADRKQLLKQVLLLLNSTHTKKTPQKRSRKFFNFGRNSDTEYIN